MPYPFVDLALARRLERTEAMVTASCTEARARLTPTSGATWTDIAGTWAMFDGVGSPATQAFGIGLSSEPSDDHLAALERFFELRGSASIQEVCPLAEEALLQRLHARGYAAFEVTNVLFRPTALALDVPATAVTVRATSVAEADLWARTAAAGWRGEAPEADPAMTEFCRVSAHAERIVSYLAELDGEPVATGAMGLGDGVVLLAGASTVPWGRRKGAQAALLAARVNAAAALGYPLAMMGAVPGSTSQRNAERCGFRIAYTRYKWMRPIGGSAR